MSVSTSPGRVRTALISQDAEADFREKFNQRDFSFEHSLARNSLFDLPALIELNQRLPGQRYFDSGDARPEDRWDQMPPSALKAAEILGRIENAKAWFVIKDAQLDPAYGAVLDDCLREAEDLAGWRFREGMRNQEMIIFVTSPHRVTQYHIDRECNFLLQVRGAKTMYVFNGNDRELLPEDEIERFWTVDNNAPKYRKEFQDRATAYRLTPGTAVHIPVNFPHWVQNGDNVSVSVSINFQFDEKATGDVYRANYYLRRLGLNPTPPGKSSTSDRMKKAALDSVRNAKRLLGRKPSQETR